MSYLDDPDDDFWGEPCDGEPDDEQDVDVPLCGTGDDD
jgi:hypothetical protein